MSGEIDVVLQQAVVFGGVATLLLAPSLPRYVPSPFRKWVVHLKRPILVAMLMYLFYLPLGAERKNFYSLLEVENNASKNDIVQGYRRVSKKYHPDKLAAAGGAAVELPNGLEADEFFLEIKKAHDVLTHDLRRSFYDRFGDMQQVGDLDDRTAIIAACLSLAVHLLCFSTGFLVSYFKHVVFARQIFVVYNIAVFCVDVRQRFVVDDDSLSFVPFVAGLLPFEKIQFFRALFPFVLVASLCVAASNFYDVSASQWAVLKALLSANRVVTERTQELIRATACLRTLSSPSTATLKAVGQQSASLQSAAVRVRGAGMELPAGTSAPQPQSAVVGGATPTAAAPSEGGLEDFTSRLSEEQRELFKKVIAEQYRRARAEEQAIEKQRARFDVNWSQVLTWACILFVWLSYK